MGFVAAVVGILPGRREQQQAARTNTLHSKYNLAELQGAFRYIDWAKLMGRLFGAKLAPTQLFLVQFPAFLRHLDRVVSLFGVRWEDVLVRLETVLCRVARLSLVVLFAQEVLEELVTVDTNRIERWDRPVNTALRLSGVEMLGHQT